MKIEKWKSTNEIEDGEEGDEYINSREVNLHTKMKETD